MIKSVLSIFSILLVSTFCLAADSFSLKGSVRDATGKAVSNAEVALQTSQRVKVASATTGQEGDFTLQNVNPGSYLLNVLAEGYVEYQQSIEIRNATAEWDIVLPVTKLMENVTVTAERGSVEDVENIPQQVNIVTNEDLQHRAKSVVAQAVEEEVGVHVQRTSPSMAGIFVRGLTGNKVNVFVDGVRFSNSAARGGVNTFLNLIEATNLDRIEILRGPSSAQYGSDALGGSVQFLTAMPDFSSTPEFKAHSGLFGNSADNGFGANVATSYSTERFAVMGNLVGHRINELRTGQGIDSRNAFTRFFGLSSDFVIDERLPDTEVTQYGGMLKTNYAINDRSQFIAGYMHTQQDNGKRYDQLLGGDGNLIADLRDLSLDLFYVKYDRAGLGWFDHATFTYSFNSQHEERVNQGGNGNPRAAINHEPERTNANGVQFELSKLLGDQHALLIGGEFIQERVDADSFREDPVTHANSVRRGRVPDNARFSSGGIFIGDVFEAVPERLRIFGNLRYSRASYEAKAEDSPLDNGVRLWPDDSLDLDDVTYRAGIVFSPSPELDLLANFSKGFRATHITDLGTLGLTGSGFEIAAPDIAGLDATIGSSAGASAVSTGRPVEQLDPETSRTYEFGVRYHRNRFDTDFAFFINDIYDNIQKQALILPPGAVGTALGDQIITAQNPNGTVFVPASTSPVLVRANFDDARIYGFEYTLNVQLTEQFSGSTIFTYIHSRDKRTDLPPNIEGGTPAPEGYLKVRYTHNNRRFWIEPYVHGAWHQDDLSSLDLEDRRTGASRSVSSITNFFNNGARARGLVSPGPDGLFGTPDDFLVASGETLAQILQRVLGPGLQSSSLFNSIPGYATLNVRFGFNISQSHELLVDFYNITDKNYRGISWGLDAPGRGIFVRLGSRF